MIFWFCFVLVFFALLDDFMKKVVPKCKYHKCFQLYISEKNALVPKAINFCVHTKVQTKTVSKFILRPITLLKALYKFESCCNCFRFMSTLMFLISIPGKDKRIVY